MVGETITTTANKARVKPLEWTGGRLRLLDQRLLPARVEHVELDRWQDVVAAIQSMQVRGAPAIGVAGAYGLALAASSLAHLDAEPFQRDLAAARPTAINLPWAVARTLRAAEAASTPAEAAELALAEAEVIEAEDLRANMAIGAHGAALLPPNARVLTHCNTGALATAGYGTALGVVRAAWERGALAGVVATETRPLLQGSRLTAWELAQEGIPVTLIVDGAAASVLRDGGIDAVIVGADRIAANGDVANKIGTYALALLARAHGVPFYVAAPSTTVDLDTPTGDAITVEQRDPDEVAAPLGVQAAPEGIAVSNPAFDVTPAELVTAIVTERGVHTPPYAESLRAEAD
ncbi:MAG: S-methyl-5-thioribose-1-phosphate isomerase [Chloroflexota bacterium]|nr:S-methyl-5-thioribose-1-phosphate isomerase [Chloroflexota bacterium]